MAATVRPHVVALLTDFGWDDPYVGCLKGALTKVNPLVPIVDVCHTLPAHDVAAAAFMLGCVYNDFPERTIFICVVDPGVGSERGVVVVPIGRRYFIAPDNGLLSAVYDDPDMGTVLRANQEHFFLPTQARTFHGRDIMAPLAGWISRGVAVENMGEPIRDFVRLELPKPQVVGGTLIEGQVMLIDRFGNCVTNISRGDVAAMTSSGRSIARVVVNGREITTGCEYYAQAPQNGSPVYLFGSLGYLEIACNSASASAALDLTTGTTVGLIFE